ncbi:MAG: class I SAM-dependent methyltransferase [Candidatus Diapherotrites archaeon]|nr:class I SAM-dependent methyltransferase [Candidatus Diapherotrites archaeon]
MHIYGKGRKGKFPKYLDRQKIKREPQQIARKWRGKPGETRKVRAYVCQDAWGPENNSLQAINQSLHYSLSKSIRKRITEIRPRPVVVLDWGCGRGVATEEIAKKFGRAVRVYGFADIAHDEWAKSRNVKYIHGVAEDLSRYLKNGSVDLLYSHTGLWHLSNEFPANLAKLLPKLAVGGKLVTDIGNLEYFTGWTQKAIELACKGTELKFKTTIKTHKTERLLSSTLIIEREK